MSINHSRYDQYKIVFQQFSSKFDLLELEINRMTADVVQRIIQITSDDMIQEDTIMSESDTYDQLIRDLVDEFKNETNISPGVIKDALYSKKYCSYIKTILA